MKQVLSDIWAYVLSHPRKIFLLALAGVLVLWVIFGNYGVVARFRMEAENRMLRELQEQEELKIIENTRKIRSADNPETIEKIAREKYNFSKDDETLFIIEDKKK
ncbi:septum formation initiator family protein [Prosthecochloris sp. SCSIO W1101]|uniref:FtsB family cell division protein n=1 Tax=Prosthecochloris sp. SCSIO W1101 TaxID=2992242 RepID=UPI00223C8D12|nr:septum formation initiator family protein [Prosthecochloris sp. SCSIO W1101]UZJ41205.1 septum formation initiator family protein [Prosthecochloris sp. SCSIO W1101]